MTFSVMATIELIMPMNMKKAINMVRIVPSMEANINLKNCFMII